MMDARPQHGASGTSEGNIINLLRRDGIISGNDFRITSLSGGISSEVFLVENSEKCFVVKQALPQLRVKGLWQADTSRNRNEYEYFRYVGSILPEAVPSVLSVGNGYFTMKYIGSEFSNWKELLMGGDCHPWHAESAARTLGQIHRASAADPRVARLFDTTSTFHQLRTEPYLLTTGRRHPRLAGHFEEEAIRLEKTRECLVHGDYSPKNILVGNGRVVVLDCEVAWYGDASFDLAFLMTHVLLKSLYHAPKDVGLEILFVKTFCTYCLERMFEPDQQQDFESRTARLLLMLLLARIDGRSPVEYLSAAKCDFAREFVASELCAGSLELSALATDWFTALHERYREVGTRKL